MVLETFDDVIASIKKKSKRPFHLLLGNGFSMAYNPNIFSYNVLHDFVEELDDEDLSIILSVIEIRNFEIIMQNLDMFSALVLAFEGDTRLKKKIDAASVKLKNSLLDAVKALHPEHVFKIPEEESEMCSKFLKIFLNTSGKIFSTNYDLLLYWVLMRNEVLGHVDGFGRELENPDEVKKGDEEVWSELFWGKHRDEQNVFYLHGALPFFDAGVSVIKEEYDVYNYLLQKISNRMEKGEYPIFVTAGNGEQKLNHIKHNEYLTHCYDSLCTVGGSLVTFGFNFGEYDEHIIDAINKAAKFRKKDNDKLWSLYIGVYSDTSKAHIERIADKFKVKKIHIYDAKTAPVWR